MAGEDAVNVVEYRFSLNIPQDELMRMYRGQARFLRVRTDSGIVLQLGVDKLRPLVGHSGIQGRFVLRTDMNNGFISLQRE
ncbi:DUF2835 family protein [Pokkaliibacter sp. MBI-7]|uniref:DUF2835 family protein n=1 Tax=Pokkaliibacter sp. MBI-7 TaxID=3040600 RepID=UPI0024491577|nr:DUF2835 family protein [Pokkaliibacter sp. MBI-7]MDH2431713.1 DUF2835 family protein [Pokkaliibacter sp. MBI-7]